MVQLDGQCSQMENKVANKLAHMPRASNLWIVPTIWQPKPDI